MPEGIEVKISAELIRPLVVGKTIKRANTTPNSRYGEQYTASEFEGIVIDEVCVKGKFMYWLLNNHHYRNYMLCTFGMSGQWSPTEGKHPCFFVEFTDGTSVYFNDPRHFGTIQFTDSKKRLDKKLGELGWDPLAEDPATWLKYLSTQIQRSGKPIGELLMDQKLFAGVGNYIRAEALYAAKLSPWRAGNKLSIQEISALCDSLVSVMKESYSYQGATIHTYKDSYGNEGRYSSCFKVYSQKQDPLGNNIIKETTPEGRSIHWCPTVQV